MSDKKRRIASKREKGMQVQREKTKGIDKKCIGRRKGATKSYLLPGESE